MFLFPRQGVWLIAVAAMAVGLAPARGGEKAAAPSEGQIAEWIRQLDADEFSRRETAQEKLAAAGKAAVPELAKAAVGDSLEVTVRSMDLLGKCYQSSDEATRKAAKDALETIAKSNRAAAARRAEQILKPPPKPGETQPAMGGIILGQGMGGVIRIQGNVQVAGGAGVKKTSVTVTNGVKQIDAEEDGKKIKIVDDPQKGIKIEVTSKKDGKDVTEKYEAKDAEELKKKQPEGYKVYKQYGEGHGAGGAQIQIQVGGMGGGMILPAAAPAAAPTPPAPAAAVPAATTRNLGGDEAVALSRVPGAPNDSAELLQVEIDVLNVQMTRHLKSAAFEQAPKEWKEHVRKQIRELKERLTALEKRLGEAEQKPAEKKQP
ncbi:MAG: hypothetical protein ABR915_15685 [Thermoguttaceae bacterium]|jgi:hypothetical protein